MSIAIAKFHKEAAANRAAAAAAAAGPSPQAAAAKTPESETTLGRLLEQHPDLVNDVSTGGALPLHTCGMSRDNQHAAAYLIEHGTVHTLRMKSSCVLNTLAMALVRWCAVQCSVSLLAGKETAIKSTAIGTFSLDCSLLAWYHLVIIVHAELTCVLAIYDVIKGADIEAVDTYGFTPLHRMASNNLAVGASALLDAGADPKGLKGSGVAATKGTPSPVDVAMSSRASVHSSTPPAECARDCIHPERSHSRFSIRGCTHHVSHSKRLL